MAILFLPHNKTIIRTNLAPSPYFSIKLLGIEYPSWHAEARIIHLLISNTYYLKLIEKIGEMNLLVLRYNKRGMLTGNSKPCSKCQRLFKLFKKKFLPSVKIIVSYLEDFKVKTLIF